MKLAFTVFACALLLLLMPLQGAAQGFGKPKEPTTLKAGVSYVWLSDYDSQGLMFYNDFHHYVGGKVAVGMNIAALSASRYDEGMKIYTIKNTFYMASMHATVDLMQNETLAMRLGAGPTVRHRAEINSDAEGEGTVDGSVEHIRTSDVGAVGYLENDFFIFKNGVAGGRIGYHYYTKGTAVFSLGFHLGFSF